MCGRVTMPQGSGNTCSPKKGRPKTLVAPALLSFNKQHAEELLFRLNCPFEDDLCAGGQHHSRIGFDVLRVPLLDSDDGAACFLADG